MDLTQEFPLTIYNSFGRGKQTFKPINPPFVGLYVCGPTVYGEPHLGHARAAVVFDIVFRYLNYLGYKVRYVRNITDVGHLEDELAGAGEDKIIRKARLEQLEPMEIVQKYTYSYHDACARLNTLPPGIEPSATGHIPEQIKIVEAILRRGYAYEVNGSVYLDMDRYVKHYSFGELSGKVLEDLQSGSRALDGQMEKRDPKDFALWKKARSGHIMKWDSPWGEGFPGWHLECTAMSSRYLGIPFDIHGGGMDLQFPHHEGEIAQSCCAFGEPPVRYWMHNNMLTMEGQKMAKSKGNFINFGEMITGDHELLERAYSPMVIRYFMLQAHYRSPIDFSNEALQAAEKGYQKMMQALDDMDRMKAKDQDDFDFNRWKQNCLSAMNDDFNTPILIAQLFEGVRVINSNINGTLSLTQKNINGIKQFFTEITEEVLGLQREESGREAHNPLDGVMQLLIDLRNTARANKDWATSDKIRDQLGALGIQLKDGKERTFWTQNE